MTHAYSENYLEDAMRNLGEAFDYAVNACGLTLESFAELFLESGYADSFGNGNPKLIAGLSGTELVMDIYWKMNLSLKFPQPQVAYDCSAEYWCGWILAYYQWYTALSFREILAKLPMQEFLKLYPTLHEASEDKFVDTANAIISRR